MFHWPPLTFWMWVESFWMKFCSLKRQAAVLVVVKFYKIEFWVEVTFFILLLRASKHSQLLLFSKNGIWWGEKSLYICVNPFKTLTKWDKIRVKNCQLGSVKKKKNSKGRDCSIWGKSIFNLQMSFCIAFI